MSKYEFRLKTLQRVRETTRDERRTALAAAFRAAEILAAKQDELATEEIVIRALQRAAARGQYLDVNRLLETQRYRMLINSQGEDLAKQSALLAAEIERRRQQLVEADREVRVLELLDERQRREHDCRQARLETRQLDETALLQWLTR